MPETCGDYILRTTLLNPSEEVNILVVSEWTSASSKRKFRPPVAEAVLYIPAAGLKRQPSALAHRLGLTVPDPQKPTFCYWDEPVGRDWTTAARRSKKPSPEAQAS